MKNKKYLIGLLIILGLITIYLVSANSKTSKDLSVEPKLEEKPIEDKKDKPDESEEFKQDKDITFLALGVDEGERSDSIIVCKYFASTGKVSILSIPRDTRIEIPGYGFDKINHAHAYEGAELSLKAINNLLDMDIEYYVRVDYDLLKEVVDTIGGVEIYITEDTEFWDKGKHKFYGEEAVEFVRYRAGYYNQDFGRMASQQEFLKQVIVKMKDTNNILSFSKMMKSGVDNIDTNMSIKELMSYALILKDVDTSKIDMEILPGESKRIDNISYIVLYQDEIPTIVEDLFINDRVDEENKN